MTPPFLTPVRTAAQTFLVGLALSTTVLLTPATAKTVIGEPPLSEVEALIQLRGTLLLTYDTACLPDQSGLEPNPTLSNVCATLSLLVEAVRSEQERLCRAVPGLPDCPPALGVTAPWTERVE